MTARPIQQVTDLRALEQWHAVSVAALAHDFAQLPADPIEERIPDIDGTAPDIGSRTELWSVEVAGTGVAAAAVSLPTADNTQSASIDLRVHPEHRGRGHGRTLLHGLLEELSARGRPRVLFEVPSPYPAGAAPLAPLLQSVGARPVLAEVRRTVDLFGHAITAAPSVPTGYRLHQWEDAAPDHLVDDVARLKQRMSTDAPMEDMDWEPELWDAARYRAEEELVRLQGRRRMTTAVEHEESGQLAGFTEIATSARAPEVGYQWSTLVASEHRGRRLGLVLKAHNHRFVAEAMPRTRWINTWNAESNTYMVSVNEVLGFEPREWWTGWQLDR